MAPRIGFERLVIDQARAGTLDVSSQLFSLQRKCEEDWRFAEELAQSLNLTRESLREELGWLIEQASRKPKPESVHPSRRRRR